MPVYRHKLTEQTQELTEEVAAIYGDVFEKVMDESRNEMKARVQREAMENKVEIEFDDDVQLYNPDATTSDAENTEKKGK